MKRLFMTVTLIVIGLSIIAWLPIGSGIQPAVRTLIREIHDVIDPGTYVEFKDDFFKIDTAIWDTTSVVVDAGSIVALVDSLGIPGCIKISAGAATKGTLNGMNLQTIQAPFRLTASPANPDSATVPFEYEVRFMLNDVTQNQVFLGLSIEDESMAGHSYSLMMVKYDNSTTAYAKAIKANTAAMDSSSMGALVARTWYRLKIVWNGASARFYLNDVLKATLSTAANFPAGTHIKPTFEICEGDSTVDIAYLDYVWARQKR